MKHASDYLAVNRPRAQLRGDPRWLERARHGTELTATFAMATVGVSMTRHISSMVTRADPAPQN